MTIPASTTRNAAMVSGPSWRRPIFAAMKFSDHITTVRAMEIAMVELEGRLSCALGGVTRLGQPDFIDSEALDKVQARRKPDAWSAGDANGALRRNGDFGFNDVFVPVAAAGGNVAGKRKIRQRGERDVVSASDAGFEHPSAPNRHAALLAEVVNSPRHRVSTDSSELDVDDAARAQFQRFARLFFRVDALVEADRSLQQLLQLDVAV